MAKQEVKKITQFTVKMKDEAKATTYTVGVQGVTLIVETESHFVIWYGDGVGHGINRAYITEFDFTLTKEIVDVPDAVAPGLPGAPVQDNAQNVLPFPGKPNRKARRAAPKKEAASAPAQEEIPTVS